jgi:hypothetical protein
MLDKDWLNQLVDAINKTLKNKLSTFLNCFFPGFLILEILFNKGFYNNNIENIVNLILYILWGCILSILFNASFNVSIQEIFKSALMIGKTPLREELGDKLSTIIFEEIKKKNLIDYVMDIIELHKFVFSGIRVGLLYMIYKITDIIVIPLIGKIYVIEFSTTLKVVFSFMVLIIFNKFLKGIFVKTGGKKLRKHLGITGLMDS